VLLAASPLLEGISRLYFEDCNEAQQLTKRPSDFTGGYAGYALDLENADRLWNLSMKLIRRNWHRVAARPADVRIAEKRRRNL
jgi:hypothetical protein